MYKHNSVLSKFLINSINNMYLWKGKDEPSKYQDVIDFIQFNEFNDKLIEFRFIRHFN